MSIDEENNYKHLVEFYQQFNSSQSSLACVLELKAFQNALKELRGGTQQTDVAFIRVLILVHLTEQEQDKFNKQD
ncbi:unnamed protein product [Rotaria sp. Silwood1]|nr:unnamed protein product [Rotaria sp. Silwood1]CAF3552719.1 unnamed protein product [Rotaria sp. Silwood1]